MAESWETQSFLVFLLLSASYFVIWLSDYSEQHLNGDLGYDSVQLDGLCGRDDSCTIDPGDIGVASDSLEVHIDGSTMKAVPHDSEFFDYNLTVQAGRLAGGDGSQSPLKSPIMPSKSLEWPF